MHVSDLVGGGRPINLKPKVVISLSINANTLCLLGIRTLFPLMLFKFSIDFWIAVSLPVLLDHPGILGSVREVCLRLLRKLEKTAIAVVLCN